jgi:hypothetical protein
MTEITQNNGTVDPTQPQVMPASPPEAPSGATEERLQALRAARAASAGVTTESVAEGQKTKVKKASGPAPSRIIAAAVSVSAGIGLVALMAGAQQDIVVQVNPTPVTVQPANVVVEMKPAVTSGNQTSPAEVEVRIVEAAAPAERPVPQAKVVTQSEGS